jgi:hypothetical protein
MNQEFYVFNITPPWLSMLIHHMGDEHDPLVAAVQRHSLTPATSSNF